MPDVKYSVWLGMARHISQMAVYIASSMLPRRREAHSLWLSGSPRDPGKPEGSCCLCHLHSCLLSPHDSLHQPAKGKPEEKAAQ